VERAVSYHNQVKRLAERYKVDVQVEAHLIEKERALLIVTHQCDERKPLPYLIHMTLIPALIRLGITVGGVPYGVGIWNTPFITAQFDKKRSQFTGRIRRRLTRRTF